MATTAAPVSIAAALPRLCECRTTTAPASRATCCVLSSEPSSTTSTRSTCGMARAERTVAAMRRDSSLAGMITATRWRALWAAALRASTAALRRPPPTGVGTVSTDSTGRGRERLSPPGRRRPSPPLRVTVGHPIYPSRSRWSAQRDLTGDQAGPGAALVGVQRRRVGERGLEPGQEVGDGLLDVLGLRPLGQLPDRHDQTGRSGSSRRTWHPRSRTRAWRAGGRARRAPPAPRAAAPSAGTRGRPCGTSTRRRRTSSLTVSMMPASASSIARLQVRRALGVGGQPVARTTPATVTSNGTRQVQHVLQARAGLGQADGLDGGAGLDVDRLEQRVREVAADVVGAARRSAAPAGPGRRRGAARASSSAGPSSPARRARRTPSVVRAVAVAAGTSSLSATQSGSPGSPSNGRSTKSDEFLAMPERLPVAHRAGPAGQGVAASRTLGEDRDMDPRAGTPAQPSDLVDLDALDRRVLRPRARPRRPGAAGGVRHQRPPRLGARHRVQRGAHRRDHRRDRRVPARRRAPTARCSSAGTRTRCPSPAWRTALEVLAAAGVEVHVDARDSWTPTPAVSHAILRHNGAGSSEGVRTHGPGPGRRHRRDAVAQPAARRRLQVQPAGRRPRRVGRDRLDRRPRQRDPRVRLASRSRA